MGEVAPDDVVERLVTEQNEVAIAEVAPSITQAEVFNNASLGRDWLVTMELERTRVALVG